MSWTKSGTVSLTNNSKTVYGSGTTWAAGGNARAGDVFVSPSGALYEVDSIPSNTELHLVNNYLGATASGQGYALIHTGLLPAELAVGLSDLQSKYLATIAQLYEWETSVAATVPITNPATGVTSNVKPLAGFLASLGNGSVAGVFTNLTATGNATFGNDSTVDVHGFAGNTTFYSNTPGTAVKVTQNGSGHALVVEDVASDATPFVISNAGALGVGTSTPRVPLEIVGALAVAAPADYWAVGNGVYSVGSQSGVAYGQLDTNGGYEISLTANGYRNSAGTWTAYSINGNAGAAMIRLNPAGYIAFCTEADKVSGSSMNVTERLRISSAGAVTPAADNSQTMGSASARWSVVYAGSGSINTSDARLKTPVATLNAAELAAARRLADEVGTFRFLEAVAEKGDRARLHVGLTVQRAIEIMDGEGLDPLAYGFVCHDQWDEQTSEVETDAADPEGVAREAEVQRTERQQNAGSKVEMIDGRPVLVATTEEVDVPVFEAVEVVDEAGRVVMVIDQPATEAVLDETGNEVQPARAATYRPMRHRVPVMETVTRYYKAVVDRPAGDRYSFRYDELAMYLCRGFADRLAALEAAP